MNGERGDKGDKGERGYNGHDGTNGTNGEKGTPCKEDHDLLIRIDEKLDKALAQCYDHENRIRDIEINGSKPAEKALAECGKLGDRITPLEKFHTSILAYAASISITISLLGTWVLNQLRVT